jgi:hypothetical protein
LGNARWIVEEIARTPGHRCDPEAKSLVRNPPLSTGILVAVDSCFRGNDVGEVLGACPQPR